MYRALGYDCQNCQNCKVLKYSQQNCESAAWFFFQESKTPFPRYVNGRRQKLRPDDKVPSERLIIRDNELATRNKSWWISSNGWWSKNREIKTNFPNTTTKFKSFFIFLTLWIQPSSKFSILKFNFPTRYASIIINDKKKTVDVFLSGGKANIIWSITFIN